MKVDMAPRDPISALERAFEIPMPARARAIADRHVRAAIAAEPNRGSGSFGRFTRLRVALLAVVTTALIGGSVAASGALLDRLVTDAPVVENALRNAQEIGESATDSGYTIVLQRAAVDSGRVWVALTLADPGRTADFGRMQVTDANGMVLTGGTGVGTGDESADKAAIFAFAIPDGTTPHGPFTLDVTSLIGSHVTVDGHWRFTFDVPAASRP